jgi:GR25 family glycosyltransferase involved in LPS biosynthesis
MDTYYINLESAKTRRQSIEENFGLYGNLEGRGGKLNRVEAVDAGYIAAHAVPGKIRDAEKACILSHRRAIELSCHDGDHSLIVEDDARFGPNTFRSIDMLGSVLDDYDIVYTDLVVGNIHEMIQYFLLRRKLLDNHTFRLFDLKESYFFGATAYIVQARSKEKILRLIDGMPSYELPYDFLLRQWINEGHLKAAFTFPFLTTLSSHADQSGIQLEMEQISNTVLNAYRRLVWQDFEQVRDDPFESLNKIDANFFDTQSLCFAQILSALLSPTYRLA